MSKDYFSNNWLTVSTCIDCFIKHSPNKSNYFLVNTIMNVCCWRPEGVWWGLWGLWGSGGSRRWRSRGRCQRFCFCGREMASTHKIRDKLQTMETLRIVAQKLNLDEGFNNWFQRGWCEMCRFQKCLYLILRMLPRRVTGFAEKSSSPLGTHVMKLLKPNG